MRDKNKNKEYFEEYIQKRLNKINSLKEKLDVNNRIMLHQLFREQLNLFQAKFSIGANKEELSELYLDILNTCENYVIGEYDDLIKMHSIAILLDINHIEKMKSSIENHKDSVSQTLLEYFNYEIEADEDIFSEHPYDLLDVGLMLASDEEECVELLTKFLVDDWYKSRSHCYWYASLKSSNDTYFGYWCFEAMAFAKIYKVNPGKLSSLNYFPII